MKVVKKTAEYTIYQKRNNRYGVKGSSKKWINGDEKTKILVAEGLVTVTEPSAPAEESAEEAPAEEAAADEAAAEEAPAEEAAAEDAPAGEAAEEAKED